MGLIDDLSRSALDTALGAHSARVLARRQFRADLVAALRSYSELVEQLRLCLLRVRDELDDSPTLATDLLPPSLLAALEAAYENSRRDGTDEAFAAYGQLAEQAHRDEDDRSVDQAGVIVSERTGLELRRVGSLMRLSKDRPPDLSDPTVRARRRPPNEVSSQEISDALQTLDEAWVALRPRLDEAMDFEAVAVLRSYRHDLRHLVRAVAQVLSRLDPNDRRERDAAIQTVEAVLFAADRWNLHINGTTETIRGDRPM